jgi:N-methylhydantoinase A
VEYGYPIRFPSVDVITIGAGGGSLAWIDEGGSLRNGPQSAGAEPGPASYGRGGTEPTNTDANLVLGRLGARLLGGKLTLDVEAARRAVGERVGRPLGMDAVAAAEAIVEVANANMGDALRLISIQRGYDPRDFALVAFGGAGPLHAADLAREMSIPTVIVPANPGTLSALGCLLVKMRHDLTKTVTVTTSEADLEALEGEFRAMEAELLEQLRREGVGERDAEIARYLDMRYFGQWRYLSVPCGRGGRLEPAPLLEAFHAAHEREFAYSQPGLPVEVFGVRVTAVGNIPTPEMPAFDKRQGGPPEPVERRPVYFAEAGGFVDTPVFSRDQLGPAVVLSGPAVVEQLDSTTVLPPGVRAEVDRYLNLIMQIG